MNQKELVTTIANLSGLPKAAILDVLQTASEVIAETLAEGAEDVSFPGLGKFKSLRRPVRRMVLPTGQERLVGGKRVAKLVPGAAFRQSINGGVTHA
jgi:nucleoid DNA-binding protein